MPFVGFRKKTNIRVQERQIADIDRVVVLNPEKYFSRSHFVRCAIAKLLRSEVKK